MMKPLPDIDQEYNLILQEEKQRSLTAMSYFTNGSTAFNVSLHGRDIFATNHSALVGQHRNYNPGYVSRGTLRT